MSEPPPSARSALARTRLLFGVPVTLAAAVLVTTLLGVVRSWHWLLAADDAVIAWLAPYADRHHWWVVTNQVLSTAFGPNSFRLVALVLLVVTLQRGARRHALLLVAGPLAGGLVMEALKRIVDRPRPREAVTDAFSSSYPSGHAFGVTVGVLVTLWVAWPFLGAVARRWAGAAGVLLVLLVGFSRLALLVHHLSDVLAGYALGVLWVAAVLLATRPGRDGTWGPRPKRPADAGEPVSGGSPAGGTP